MRSTSCWAAAACLVFSGCGGGTGIATATDFDRGTDFSAYRTYVWVPDGDGLAEAPIDGFIREAVDRELAAKGLAPAEDAEADVAVGYRVVLNTSTTQEMVGRGWRGGYRSTGGYSGGGAGVLQRDVEHETGTLFIVVFDESSKESVWTGVGNGAVERDRPPEERRQRIDRAVREILSGYPSG